MLRYATFNGAEHRGLGDRTGTLTRGKQADIVLLDAHAEGPVRVALRRVCPPSYEFRAVPPPSLAVACFSARPNLGEGAYRTNGCVAGPPPQHGNACTGGRPHSLRPRSFSVANGGPPVAHPDLSFSTIAPRLYVTYIQYMHRKINWWSP
ncbi:MULTISPECIES: amidohydrolase family protein [unclassified Nonomuraea]|uniref:amidohydrolase family protein n=1 Tax=unclassified Nonomuraea TaxID=2593643 RepID=UPI00191BF730